MLVGVQRNTVTDINTGTFQIPDPALSVLLVMLTELWFMIMLAQFCRRDRSRAPNRTGLFEFVWLTDSKWREDWLEFLKDIRCVVMMSEVVEEMVSYGALSLLEPLQLADNNNKLKFDFESLVVISTTTVWLRNNL